MNNSKLTMRDIVLNMEAENNIKYDIGHRGGTYGAATSDVIAILFPTLSDDKIDELANLLPNMVGVHCNYLGGGLRGSLVRSDYSERMPAKYAKRINAFTRECKARYLAIEDSAGLNEEEDADGNTNWDAYGSNRIR